MNSNQTIFLQSVILPKIVSMAIDCSLPMDLTQLGVEHFQAEAEEFNKGNIAYVMVGNEDAINAFKELNLNEIDEDEKEEFFNEHLSSFEVGKYDKSVLDFDLMYQIQNWGSYCILDENEYEFLR